MPQRPFNDILNQVIFQGATSAFNAVPVQSCRMVETITVLALLVHNKGMHMLTGPYEHIQL